MLPDLLNLAMKLSIWQPCLFVDVTSSSWLSSHIVRYIPTWINIFGDKTHVSCHHLTEEYYTQHGTKQHPDDVGHLSILPGLG